MAWLISRILNLTFRRLSRPDVTRSSNHESVVAFRRGNIKSRDVERQSSVKVHRKERKPRSVTHSKSRRTERTNSFSSPLSPCRRVTRASTACADGRDERTIKSRPFENVNSHGMEVTKDTKKFLQEKQRRPHSKVSKHLDSTMWKSSSANYKGKSSKPKDTEAELKKRIIDLKASYIKLEKKVESQNLYINQIKRSEKSLERSLKKAVAEKATLKDKWIGLKTIKKSLKQEVNKQSTEIESLKVKLFESEQKVDKSISDNLALTLEQSDPTHSTSEMIQVQGNENLFQDMLENLKHLLESQLQCSVCNEVYAFSVTITCGHTFCSECIEEWKCKKRNCPICRSAIISQVHTKVLDDYIDKFVDGFVPETFKQTRKEFLDERKRKMELREQNNRENRCRRNPHNVSNALRSSSDIEMNSVDERIFVDVELSSEDGADSQMRHFQYPIDRQLSISPIRLPSSTSSSASSLERRRFDSHSSESDTTWNPPLSDQLDRLSDVSVLSELSTISRDPSNDRSESLSGGFIPVQTRSRTRSRSRNRSISRTTSASRSSQFLSRCVSLCI